MCCGLSIEFGCIIFGLPDNVPPDQIAFTDGLYAAVPSIGSRHAPAIPRQRLFSEVHSLLSSRLHCFWVSLLVALYDRRGGPWVYSPCPGAHTGLVRRPGIEPGLPAYYYYYYYYYYYEIFYL